MQTFYCEEMDKTSINIREIFILFVFISVALVSGCSTPITDEINGRWQKYEQNGEPVTPQGWLEFFANGSVALNNASGGPENTLPGSYSLSNEGRIKIVIEVFAKELIMIGGASISDEGDLILDLEKAGLTKWKRI